MEGTNLKQRGLETFISENALMFSVSHSQNLYKQSSTSLLAITFIIFVAYTVAKFIQNKNTSFGLDVFNFKQLNNNPYRKRELFQSL
jgi:flagellar biogenesis protein FliO